MRQGGFFKTVRFLNRLLHPGWQAEVPPPSGARVYICRHKNMQGPLMTLTFLPFPVRTWVYYVFFDRETCYRQYVDYTFSKRYHMPMPVARTLAWVVSGLVSALIRSTGAIAVHRGTVRIHETFRESLDALKAGDSLLVFPDVDYTSEDDAMGAMYEGFLLLGRSYGRATGKGLTFIPLHVDEHTRRIVQLTPVTYNPAAKPADEKARVREALHTQLAQTTTDN